MTEKLKGGTLTLITREFEDGTIIACEEDFDHFESYFDSTKKLSYEPKLKHYKREFKISSPSTFQDFEDVEFAAGQIVNATKKFNFDFMDKEIKEVYTVKNGRLEGAYIYKNNYRDMGFSVHANFKNGVLDGDFLMIHDKSIVKKGHYDNGVFHGEYHPDIEVETAFCKDINDIHRKCLNPPKELVVDGSQKLAILRKKIAHDIDDTLGTHLEEKKITKPLKKIEKAISAKLFDKGKE